MKPMEFKNANTSLGAPEGMENCVALPCWTNHEVTISKWSLSWRERFKLLFQGRMWLWVWGYPHHPVSLDVNEPQIQWLHQNDERTSDLPMPKGRPPGKDRKVG